MERVQSGNWASRLRRFLTVAEEEHCDFCSKTINWRHAHLLERATRKFFCACPECAFLLGDGDRFAALRARTHALRDFELSDSEWRAFRIPIDLAFVFHSTSAQGPVAIYPGPAGATESLLAADAWSRLAAANPALVDLTPDVEALLVNRMNGSREYYVVSIDRCYALVGLIRRHWRGLSGGTEVWEAVRAYFRTLRDGIEMEDAVHG
ncbi:MAG: DUF5947 family protein [Methylocystis sp.]|uniref:DUF5947 family protein n=1 Tax=Methylocystis sp. TaxID=1911079 RepID=UPI003D0FADBB